MRVKTVKTEGEATLVEYSDGDDTRRVIVPMYAIDERECDKGVLMAGIEYGENWEKHIGALSVDGALKKLRKLGVWTWEDLERNPLAIRQALHATVETNIQNVLRALAQRVR